MEQDWLTKEKALTYIKIPYPKDKDLKLKITAPRCKMTIAPGIGNAWVTGRYTDEKYIAPMVITQSRNSLEVLADSSLSYRAPVSYLPEMRLSFGRQRAFSLNIRAGNVCDEMDFGGIALTQLEIQYESGEQEIDFSYPIPGIMKKMEITADGGMVKIMNLANASPKELRLGGDEEKYRVEFGGDLKHDMKLYASTGVSRLEIIVPKNMAVIVRYAYPPDPVNLDGFTAEGKEYWNQAARNQSGPVLRILNSSVNDALRIQTVSGVDEVDLQSND